MKAKTFTLFGALMLLGACSSTSGTGADGKPDDMAGGQSGTDGAGSYYCDLTEHTSAELALDEPLGSQGTCTAENATAQLAAIGAFDCGELGTLELSVGAATGAQRLTGLSYSDTGEAGPGVPCNSLGVDAPLQLTTTGSSVVLDATSFVVGHLCTNVEIEAEGEGGVHWRLFAGISEPAGLVVSVGEGSSILCDPVPKP